MDILDVRKTLAIEKNIENPFGRFFCWHDWTLMGIHIPEDVSEMIDGRGYSVACTKCGKRKAVSQMPIEPIE